MHDIRWFITYFKVTNFFEILRRNTNVQIYTVFVVIQKCCMFLI